MRRRFTKAWAVSLAFAGVAAATGLSLAAQQQPGALLATAVRGNDSVAVGNALSELWTAKPRDAAQASANLLTGQGNSIHRPIVTELAAKRADADILPRLILALDKNRHRDERRILVRALGRLSPDVGPKLIKPFLNDSDPYVQVAALYALADSGLVASAEMIIPKMAGQAPHRERGSTQSSEQALVTAAAYASFLALTGARVDNAQAATKWLSENRPGPRQRAASPDDRFYAAADSQGREQFSYFEFAYQPAAAAKEFKTLLQKQSLSDGNQIAREFAQVVSDVSRETGGVFGAVYPIIVAIDMRNDQTYGTGGSRAGHMAQASGGLIQLNTALFEQNGAAWSQTLRHELIHVVHGNQFISQPRWLAEGLAQSYESNQLRASPWTYARVMQNPDRRVRDVVNGGVFAAGDQWRSGMSSDRSGEAPLYQASHIAVDYLRFGVPSAAETRINYLMGALSRGLSLEQALRTVYGKSISEMDQDVLNWLKENGAARSSESRR